MGLRGPAPKKPEQLAGHVSRAKRDGDTYKTVSTNTTITHKVKPPNGHSDWTDSAKLLYKSAKISAQSALYEPTDWEMLRLVASDLSNYQTGPRVAKLFESIVSALDDLLLAEGSRRRASIDLDVRATPVKPPPADKAWHPDAKRLWKAAAKSSQAMYYEPSDWAYLHLALTELTYHRVGGGSGQLYAVVQSMFAQLLLTEGTRRVHGLDLGTAEDTSNDPTLGDKEIEKWMIQLTKVP